MKQSTHHDALLKESRHIKPSFSFVGLFFLFLSHFNKKKEKEKERERGRDKKSMREDVDTEFKEIGRLNGVENCTAAFPRKWWLLPIRRVENFILV